MTKTPFAETDIVYSSTPLETNFAGIHPRLFADDNRIAALHARLQAEPWKSFLQRVIVVANPQRKIDFASSGDLRPYGEWLLHNAVAFRMTGDKLFLRTAVKAIRAMAAREDWTTSLQYGHWASGMALAYDWLHHDLTEATRQLIRETLADRTERVFRNLVAYRDAYALGYAWNHMGVVHGGLMHAGCALWGEVDGAGRWLKLGMEKLRLMIIALGPDGASAEGQAYGQYHLDYLLKSLWLAADLLGEDLFADCAFLRNHSTFMLHSTLPRNSWRAGKGGGFPVALVQVSDTDEVHWHGPDSHLRVLAARLSDGRAQWLADVFSAANVNGESSCFLNLLAYDPTVAPQPPAKEPPFKHLADKDIVLMRSGWEDDCALAVFKCGPNSGHHAARSFRHNVAGGHMHPDAGHIMIHACGEWLLPDDGYTKKFTSFQNTLLVNGIGQTGEGAMWFEDLEMRKGKPEGRIVRVERRKRFDLVTGDAAPAYEPAAGLQTFYRTILYFRPSLWVVIDEIKTAKPANLEIRFHGVAPFVPGDESGCWQMRGQRGALSLAAWADVPLTGRAYVNDLQKSPHYTLHRQLNGLALGNAKPTRRALFITAIHAHPAGAAATLARSIKLTANGWRVRLSGADFNHAFICRQNKKGSVDIS